MKIFLDTADLNVIKKWHMHDIIDGITTNPTSLSRVANPQEILKELCALMPDKDISVEVTVKEPGAVYKQAQEIARISKNIVVKIPCHELYYPIISQLVKEGIQVNVTLVFTLIQSLFMCKLGVKYVSIFIGRWDELDVDVTDILFSLRQMIDRYGFKTKILAASLRTLQQFHDAIESGADVATLSPSLLETSAQHVLTDNGMKKFLQDWQKLGLDRFP